MQSKRTDTGDRSVSSFRLRLAVHFAALRDKPRTYLGALWWHLVGKRLRANSRLAPLLGKVPGAYGLWIRNRESVGATFELGEQKPPIVALVDASRNPDLINETMCSLAAAGLSGLIVGADCEPDLGKISSLIDWQSGPWLMPLAAGDLVASGAAAVYRAAINGSDAYVAYADDDLVDDAGRRNAPHFKPCWNSELFKHFDFLTGACVVRASVQSFSGLRGNCWMQQLTLQAVSLAIPLRVPHLLHHRRSRPHPHLPAALELNRDPLPLVSVIVPTRNRIDLLRPCLEGLEKTSYPNVEVIVVDNDSDDPATLAYLAGLPRSGYKVLRYSGPFNFSSINNRAAVEADGELLCLLNNDVEVIEPEWLSVMVAQAMRDDVGAVGAQLLYPDGRIQHSGVVLGICGGAAHAHRFLWPGEEGYFKRHLLPQFVSAVTAACLVVRRERFQAVGGFDERNFPVAFNDVDFCMRMNQQGWQSLYEPRASLIHYESVSRGHDRRPADAERFAGELAALKRLWSTSERVDQFHHPELSPFSEQFVVRL